MSCLGCLGSLGYLGYFASEPPPQQKKKSIRRPRGSREPKEPQPRSLREPQPRSLRSPRSLRTGIQHAETGSAYSPNHSRRSVSEKRPGRDASANHPKDVRYNTVFEKVVLHSHINPIKNTEKLDPNASPGDYNLRDVSVAQRFPRAAGTSHFRSGLVPQKKDTAILGYEDSWVLRF